MADLSDRLGHADHDPGRALDGWYPYPFLDPAHGGYGPVAVTVVAVTLGFLLIAGVTVAIANARMRAVRW